MASALVSLGEAEITDLFKDQAEVELTCEFCNQQFSFVRDDLEGV
jgi:redox-regulated HSP33 family molecular chaperone